MNERTIVILNPASGSADEDLRAVVEKALRAQGVEFEVWETTPEVGGAQLATRAVHARATHLIACGGDGTVMAVVNGIGRGQQNGNGSERRCVTLSIVPAGTANLLATALDIPTDPEEAIAVAVTGEGRAIDLGQCGEVLFALGLGLGLTERLVSQTSAEEKERLGRWAYAKAMLRELGERPSTFTLKLDEKPPQRRRGVAVVVANAGEIGGGLKFAPDAKMDDGLLDVCILHRFYFRDLLRLIWRSLLGKVHEDRAVSFYQVRRVEITSDPPLDLQIDGEAVDSMTPLIAEVMPRALRVRVPNELPNE